MSIHIIDRAVVDAATATHLLKAKHDDEAVTSELKKTRIKTKCQDQNGDSNSCVYPGFVIHRNA